MGIRRTGHTRRGVLGAALGAAALGSGCSASDQDEPAPRPADPLQPLLDETLALVAAYDRAAVAQPGLAGRLTPLADDHRAHAAALTAVIRVTASASAAPAVVATTVAELRAAEQTAQRNAAAACEAAPAGRAALIGSIAACRATHAEALR